MYSQFNSTSSWVGIVTSLENIISVELKIDLINASFITRNNTVVPIKQAFNSKYNDITYNVSIYCCYQADGCKNQFSSDVTVDPYAWYLVLENTNQQMDFSKNTYNSDSQLASDILLGYTFQNQEALPMRGKVQSYLFFVNFTQYAAGPEYVLSLAPGTSVQYVMLLITRPWVISTYICTIILLVATLALLYAYVNTLLTYNRNKLWLPEQKWIVWYLILIIMYQNPIFCVIVWLSKATTNAIYSSYMLDSFAQSALFVIWLLFSDGLRRKVVTNRLVFYGPKVLFGTVIMGLQYVVLTLQFCSLDPSNRTRTPLEAVQQWSYGVKIVFCIFSCGFLTALILWALWWFYSLYWTGKSLEKLPYMSTRYLQLSYQFFLTQAALVTIYYVFQYLIVIYFVFRSDSTTPDDTQGMLESVTDNINILFRQQTQLFGKILFLTVYAFILAFLFLPAEVLTSNERFRSLASTFVITEEEWGVVVRKRRKMIADISSTSRVYDMNWIVAAKAEVFCLDIALTLLHMSYEAYYDPPGVQTISGYGLMDIERYGYLLVDCKYIEEVDMFCFIARHAATNRLVVSFRGSSSKIHWKHNLNFKQRELNLAWMPLTELDAEDGLQEYVNQFNEGESCTGCWSVYVCMLWWRFICMLCCV